jgi:hypothetical protein
MGTIFDIPINGWLLKSMHHLMGRTDRWLHANWLGLKKQPVEVQDITKRSPNTLEHNIIQTHSCVMWD